MRHFLKKPYSSKNINAIEKDRFGITSDNFMFVNVDKITLDKELLSILARHIHKKVLLTGEKMKEFLDTYHQYTYYNPLEGITHLIIITNGGINYSLFHLPASLEYLQLGVCTNESMQVVSINPDCNPFTNLPCNLKHLVLNITNFTGSLAYLPQSIKTLTFICDKLFSKYKEYMMDLPSGIRNLNLAYPYINTSDYNILDYIDDNFSRNDTVKYYNIAVRNIVSQFVEHLKLFRPSGETKINLYINKFDKRCFISVLPENIIPNLKIIYNSN